MTNIAKQRTPQPEARDDLAANRWRLTRDIAGVLAGSAGVGLAAYGLWLVYPAAMYLGLGAFAWLCGRKLMVKDDATEKIAR